VKRRTAIAVGILLVAGGLRFAGLDFGLPMAEARPDELTIAFQAMKFGTGDLNPHSFNYPTLHKYVTFVLFGVHYVIGKATHAFSSKDDFLLSFFDGAVAFRLAMRIWSAAIGTAAVAFLLRSPGKLGAAALYAVAMLAVRDSHFGVTDTTMVSLALAAVVLADRAALSGRRRDVLAAAVFAGFATSTKYNAALLAFPLVLSTFRPGTSIPHAVRESALAGLAMVGAFALGSPYVLLDTKTFLTDFSFEAAHLTSGQYVDVGGGWRHHAETLVLTQGWGFVVLSVGAMALLLVQGIEGDRRRAWLWFSFPLAYYLVIGKGETAFFRYILPVLPFLCVALATALLRLKAPVALAVGVACALQGLWGSVQVDRLFLAGDTRDAMGAWIEHNVPTGARIVHAGAYTGAPMIQRNVENQTREYLAKQGRADSAGFRKPDDMKWYNADRPMYDVLFIRKKGIDFASQVDPADLHGTLLIEVETYGLVHYAAVPDSVRAMVADGSTCTLLHAEDPLANGVSTAEAYPGTFDQQDALYMPAAGFGAFHRMGPSLSLYTCRLSEEVPA
jgi:hypothetical protein